MLFGRLFSWASRVEVGGVEATLAVCCGSRRSFWNFRARPSDMRWDIRCTGVNCTIELLKRILKPRATVGGIPFRTDPPKDERGVRHDRKCASFPASLVCEGLVAPSLPQCQCKPQIVDQYKDPPTTARHSAQSVTNCNDSCPALCPANVFVLFPTPAHIEYPGIKREAKTARNFLEDRAIAPALARCCVARVSESCCARLDSVFDAKAPLLRKGPRLAPQITDTISMDHCIAACVGEASA